MDGEGLPRGWCETVLGYVWIMLGSGRIGPALELTVQASFSQLQVAGLEGSLAKKLCFHIFNSFWRWSRTKASFSQRQLAVFQEGLAWKFRFHNFNLCFEGGLSRKRRFHNFTVRFLKEVAHERVVFTNLKHRQVAGFEGGLAGGCARWRRLVLINIFFGFFIIFKIFKVAVFWFWRWDLVLEHVLDRKNFVLANIMLWCLQIPMGCLRQCCSALWLRIQFFGLCNLQIALEEGRYGLVDKTHPSCVRPKFNTRVQH